MVEQAATLQLLIDSILEKHRDLRRERENDPESDFVDFSELELTEMIEALWTERFASNRQRFRESVGRAIQSQIDKS